LPRGLHSHFTFHISHFTFHLCSQLSTVNSHHTSGYPVPLPLPMSLSLSLSLPLPLPLLLLHTMSIYRSVDAHGVIRFGNPISNIELKSLAIVSVKVSRMSASAFSSHPDQIVAKAACSSHYCKYTRGISVAALHGKFKRLSLFLLVYFVILTISNTTQIAIVDVDSQTITQIASSRQCPGPMSVDKDVRSGVVYTACKGGGVISIDGNSVVTIASSTQCPFPQGLSKDGNNDILYVACYNGGVIAITGTSVMTIASSSQCPNPRGVYADVNSGVVYAACNGGGVIAINGTNVVLTIAPSSKCPGPQGVYADVSSGVVYATCYGTGGGVIAINGTRVVTLASLTQCPYPLHLYKDVITGIVYVACADGGVIAINGTSVVTIASSSQCPTPQAVYKDGSSGVVYAGCASGVIAITDTRVMTIISSSQCPVPNSLYKDVSSGVVYASCFSGGVIALDATSVVTIASSSQCPFPLAISKDVNNDILYAACYNGGVIAITGTSVVTIASSSQCPNPRGVFVDVNSGVVYATCFGTGGGVIAINGTNVILTIASSSKCPDPHGVYADGSSGVVYATCERGGVIAINDTSVVTIASLTQCPYPQGLYKDVINGIVYVACADSGVIAINGTSVVTIASSSQCPTPQNVHKDVSSGVVYAACLSGGVIAITGTSVATIASSVLCPLPSNVYADVNSGVVHASCGRDSVIEINGTRVVTIASPSQCPIPFGVYKDMSNGVVFAVCGSGGVIAITSSFRCIPGYYWHFGECVMCSLGYFRNQSMLDQISCQPCLAGTVASKDGNLNCEICAAGKYALSPLLDCVECPLGHYVSGVASISCQPCPGGVFGSSTGLSNSVCSGICPSGYWCPPGSSSKNSFLCPIGAFCPAGSSSAIAISPGFFASEFVVNGIGAGAQKLCLVGNACINGVILPCNDGSYQDQPGATNCKPCPAGLYGIFSQSGLNSTSCSGLCPLGYYCPGSTANPIACPLTSYCPIGSARPQLIQSGFHLTSTYSIAICESGSYCRDGSVSMCEPGYYCSSKSASPIPCSAGYFQSQFNSSECIPCLPGTYQSSTGQVSCESCPAHQIAPQPGSSLCSECSQFDSPSEDRSRCIASDCPAGQYDNGDNQCILCEIGYYSSSRGATACLTCSLNTYNAQSGYFSCLSCDGISGVLCANGKAYIQPGWWGTLVETPLSRDLSNISPAIVPLVDVRGYPCPIGYCSGTASLVTFNSSGEVCSINRDPMSPLCGSCLPGFVEWRHSCVECEETNRPLLFGVVLLSLAFVLLHLVNTTSTRGLTKIWFYFIQTVIFQLGSFDSWLGWLSFVNFGPHEATGSLCITPLDPYTTLGSGAIIPIFFVAELFGILILHLIWHGIKCVFRPNISTEENSVECSNSQSRTTGSTSGDLSSTSGRQLSRCDTLLISIRSFPLDQYISALLSLLLHSYYKIAESTLRYLQCVSVGNNRVVFEYPSIDCDSTTYKQYLPLVYAFLILDVVGVPVCVLLFLLANRKEIRCILTRLTQTEAASQLAIVNDRLTPSSSLVALQVEQQQERGRPQPDHRRRHSLPSLSFESFPSPIPATTFPADSNSVQTEQSVDLSIDFHSKRHSSVRKEAVAAVSVVRCNPPKEELSVSSLPPPTSQIGSSLHFDARYGILFQSYRTSTYCFLPALLLRQVALVVLDVALSTNPTNKLFAFTYFNQFVLIVQTVLRPYRVEEDNWLEFISLFLLTIMSLVLINNNSTNPGEQQLPWSTSIAVFVLVVPFGTIVLVMIANRKLRQIFITGIQKIEAKILTASSRRSMLTSKSQSASAFPSNVLWKASGPASSPWVELVERKND